MFIAYFFINLTPKYNLLLMEHKDLNRLKLVLVEKKKTGKWLAEQLGMTQPTISKWCTNTSQPDLQMLDRIAELLECDKKDLIAD